jgi:hypothetical protein
LDDFTNVFDSIHGELLTKYQQYCIDKFLSDSMTSL